MNDQKNANATNTASSQSRGNGRGRRRGSSRTSGKARGKPQAKEKSPSWWVFTKKQTAFVAAAKKLSDALEAMYGQNVSISHYERFLGELGQMSTDQKELLMISPQHLDLYKVYKVAKEARDAERDSFRSFRNVQTVASGLEAAQALLAEESKEV